VSIEVVPTRSARVIAYEVPQSIWNAHALMDDAVMIDYEAVLHVRQVIVATRWRGTNRDIAPGEQDRVWIASSTRITDSAQGNVTMRQ
jgi:hypothetical protein